MKATREALGVGLLVACGSLLAGCGQTGQPAGFGPDTPSGPVQPKVNRVVFSVVPPASEANELRLLVQTELWVMRPMYEYLIGVDPANGRLIPQLAAKWTLEPDGKSFRFALKPGVAFHNGFGEMTGDDVRPQPARCGAGGHCTAVRNLLPPPRRGR